LTLWLVRSGNSNKYEENFINDNRIYLTQKDLDIDLRSFHIKNSLHAFLIDKYKLQKKRTAYAWASQFHVMTFEMKVNDWVISPVSSGSFFHIGEIKSEYQFNLNNPNPLYHFRDVDWFAKNISCNNFPKDILNSLGSILGICQIKNNDAEKRIKYLYENNWEN